MRRSLLTLIATFAASSTAPAWAQGAAAGDYPAKPVTLITPFAPGSGPDAVLRLVGDKLSRSWNQRVTIDNKPGGGGFIAIEAARRAPADGSVLLQLDSEHLAALPHLYKQRGFVTLQAFEPVAILFRTPFLLAVAADSKWKTVADLTAAAKAEPGKMSYGSWGIGSPGHLGAEHLEELTGTKMQHVPFREVSQLYTSVGAGEPAWSFGSIPSSSGAYKAGKLKYLAVAAAKRLPQMPEVPTFAEAGGPAGFEVNSFVVLVAPRGVPAAVRAKIHADVARAVNEADLRARFDTFAFEVLPWSTEEIERQAQAKSKVYEALIKRANISLE